jgi:hypothetical protein
MTRSFEGFRSSVPPPAAAAALLAFAAAGCAAAERPGAQSPGAGRSSITLALKRSGAVGGFEVTPLRVEEDSRCPSGVQCIQAGTVRLAVRIAGKVRLQPLMTLARPSRLGSESWLTLCAVTPYPARPGRIAPSAYRFRFVPGRGSEPPAAACG